MSTPGAQDRPDPQVLRVGAGYYLYTTNRPGVNVPVAFSEDLIAFAEHGDALPNLPDWAEPGYTWAPEVVFLAGRYVLYFSARLRGSPLQVIGAALSRRPEGPFVPQSQPIITMLHLGGAIDAAVLTTSGEHYLYWKNDGNAVGEATSLWGAMLAEDGLRLVGEPQALLSATEAWEDNLVEAPQVIEDGGVFHLLYSCGDYGEASYAVGHAHGETPLGTFRKTRGSPLLASRGSVAGPGHSHAFRTQHGWRLAFHAWEAGHCGYAAGGRRALHFAELRVQGREMEIS